ncbi:MAG: alpha/beta hydrolase [Chloroflexota bacterium]
MTLLTSTRLTIIPGAEPFWLPTSTTTGCLLIHGFTGSPAELRYLGERLQQAGVNALGVRLPGHGTTEDDLVRHGRRSWIRAARHGLEELLKHCDQVVVCGLSMGGTLALNLVATTFDDRLRGIVAMGAPVRMVDLHYRPTEILAMLNRWRDWGSPDIKDRSRWAEHIGYRTAPPRATVQMIRLVHDTWGVLPNLRQPILVMQSREDHTVMPVNAHWLLDRVGSTERQVVWINNSYHVMTVDFDADLVADRVIEFAQRMTRTA